MFIEIIFGVILSMEFSFLCTVGSARSHQSSDSLTLENCGESYAADKIVGGEPAEGGMFPWIVSLQYKVGRGFSHICGASILNEHWVVTAAHCFEEEYTPSQYRLKAGIIDLLDRGNNYKISKIFPHEAYDPVTYEDDIALMKTSKAIAVQSEFIGGICLPYSSRYPTGAAIVIGWGHMEYQAEDGSMILMQVEIPLVKHSECERHYGELQKTIVCAGVIGQDACQGDSGGPLFQTEDGVSVLIGIVSVGEDCGKHPGIYTRVSSYISIIMK